MTDHESTKSRTEAEWSVRGRRPSVLQAAQEPQVENLQLVVQLHADDAVVSVDAQQDPCGLAVLPQDHLHLENKTESALPPVTMATAEEGRGPGPVLVRSRWTHLVVLGRGDGFQMVAADTHHLLRVLHEHGAHPALQTRGSVSKRAGTGSVNRPIFPPQV